MRPWGKEVTQAAIEMMGEDRARAAVLLAGVGDSFARAMEPPDEL